MSITQPGLKWGDSRQDIPTGRLSETNSKNTHQVRPYNCEIKAEEEYPSPRTLNNFGQSWKRENYESWQYEQDSFMSSYDHSMNQPPPFKRYKKDESADPTNPNPSLVVHVRNLSNKATEADLLEALSHFGHIAYATVMPNRHMALVEFETLDGARACVVYAQSNQIYVSGQPALFNFSTSQITKPHGDVKRIAIVHPKGLMQALVEYGSMEEARRAKYAMNGADIYSGCCTLKVEFAKVDRVTVKKNDTESWDFTVPPESLGSSRRALLSNDQMPSPFINQPTTQRGYGSDLFQSYLSGLLPGPAFEQSGQGHFGGRGGNGRDDRGTFLGNAYDYQDYNPGYGSHAAADSDRRGGGGGYQENVVVMVYGLNHDNFNCDRLFNIICCYGNPIKIKFMRSKTDTAMVEMGSGKEVGNACKYLSNAPCFGTSLTLRPSKSEVIQEVQQPFELENGAVSYKDFRQGHSNRLLRFSTPDAAARNRLVYPSTTLHWYNAPPTMDETRLKEVFEEKQAPISGTVTVFKAKSERSSSGICEFESVEKAVEAIMLVNHTPVEHAEGKPPYILKLAFYGTEGGRGNDRDDHHHHQQRHGGGNQGQKRSSRYKNEPTSPY